VRKIIDVTGAETVARHGACSVSAVSADVRDGITNSEQCIVNSYGEFIPLLRSGIN